MSDELIFAALGDLYWFTQGSVTTEDLSYVLGNRVDDEPTLDFTGGSAKIYDLGPARFFALGSEFSLPHGSAVITSKPIAGFDDFAIYPEGADDPVDGFVVADTSGTLSGGSADAWTRHHRVFYPPRQARYVVPHIRLGSVAAGNAVYLDAHQMEVLPVGSVAPSAFGSARSIKVTVRPTRLNYYAGSLTVTDLVPGHAYTASADDTNGKRVWYTFTATSGTVTLDFGIANPTRILVEEARPDGKPGDYFDGNSGPDYLWEQGGTPGQARSYYYANRSIRHGILVRTLNDNVALGVTVEDPEYALLPAPSTTS